MTDLQTLRAQFQAIDQLLYQYRSDWQLRPFEQQAIPWPALAGPLWALDDEQLAVLEQDNQALFDYLAPWRPAVVAAQPAWPELARAEITAPSRLASGIPGRKWAQISDFIGAAAIARPVLEWCAGKGHLGRLAALSQGQPVLSLELQQGLCEQGERLAGQWRLEHRFVCADALAPAARDHFQANQHGLALHACGELHQRFLAHGIAAGTQALTLSPCCYHLIDQEHYRPLSATARASRLVLDRFDLRLPLQEQVTGGARQARLRHTEVHWRLAFDSLQRQLRERDEYLPLPTLPKQLLTGDFADFLAWACDRKGLACPAGLDQAHWLREGRRRQGLVRRIELVRHLYRAPLEAWLLLDRALLLAENGYQVRLGTFTDRHNTPRNLMIHAERGAH
ncbi:methyltransferase [Gallaecimonas sp. GXIMD4217]|uniref:methyltransferase n=1 Tax=Gallaecimonas sp. GXIMD4217 TaxID=3131927 RepID=UPI00311B3DD0